MISLHRRSDSPPLLASTSIAIHALQLGVVGSTQSIQHASEIDPAAFPSAFYSCQKPPRVLQRLLFTLHSTSARCCCSCQLRACCKHAALFPLILLTALTCDSDYSTFSNLPQPSILRAIDLRLHRSMQLGATWRRQLHEMRCTYCRAGSRRAALIFTAHLLSFLLANCACRSSSLDGASILRAPRCRAFTSLHILHLPLGLTKRDMSSSSAVEPSALV